MDTLEGKIAFITGGASGIGLGIARVLFAGGGDHRDLRYRGHAVPARRCADLAAGVGGVASAGEAGIAGRFTPGASGMSVATATRLTKWRVSPKQLDGMPTFVSARLVGVSIGGHAAPVDGRLIDLLLAHKALPPDHADPAAASAAARLPRSRRLGGWRRRWRRS